MKDALNQQKRRALFLDRDGVINVDAGYVGRREDFKFLPGIFELVKFAVGQGFLPIVVTNQSGIARGLFTEENYYELTKWMCSEFAERGAPLARVYHCPYLKDAKIERYQQDHDWRKPKPGMFLAAQKDFNLDLENSVMIGDQWRDLLAARAAGLSHIAILGKPLGRQPERLEIQQIFNLAEGKDWLARQL